MGSQLSIILYNVLIYIRWGGMIIIVSASMIIIISEAVKSRLSPARIIVVAVSGLGGVVIFWSFPTVANYVRVDTNTRIVQDQPIGGMYHQ